MAVGIVITVNLLGGVGGCVKHTQKQEVKVDVSSVEDKKPLFITRKITHNDRERSICYRRVKIEESIVKIWENSDCPRWERPSNWKIYNKQKKVESFVKTFDEGFGVSYEFIN